MSKSLLMGALLLVSGLMTSTAMAASRYLDSEYSRACGGYIELREAANGDLALKLDGGLCHQLKFYDVTSGRTIKSYDIQGSSYTLSKAQEASLSSDCRLGIQLTGLYGQVEHFDIVLSWWSCASQSRSSSSRVGYQLSNAGNCKLMIHGEYANKLVDDALCDGLRGKQIASYEWSRNNNCKLMIDGSYSGQNVSDWKCRQ